MIQSAQVCKGAAPVATCRSVKAVPIMPTVPRYGVPSDITPPTTSEFHSGSNLHRKHHSNQKPV